MLKFSENFRMGRMARRGAIILLLLLSLLFIFWRLLPAIVKPEEDKDELALQKAWEQYKTDNIEPFADNKEYNDPDKKEQMFVKEQKQPEIQLSNFDPNTASEKELLRLGLPKYTVNTILKYRLKAHGMAFKQKEDLKRLYTLKPEVYERIAPYVHIALPDRSDNYSGYSSEKSKQETAQSRIIEINSADAKDLMTLNGIGPGYSSRIINFRNALGGFITVEQLKEVYGFPDSTYRKLSANFTVNSSSVQKINVNIADEGKLSGHPYIGKKLAGSIIKLRNDLGQFHDIEQLRQVPLINEEKYRKIAPYLSTH